MFNKNNQHSIYISIRCDKNLSHYDNKYRDFERLRNDLSKLGGVIVSVVVNQTYHDPNTLKLIDTYFSKITYPKEMYNSVNALIKQHATVFVSTEKPPKNPCPGPGNRY